MRQQAVDEIITFLAALPEFADLSVRPWPEDPQGELARCLPKGKYALYVQWIYLKSERGDWIDRRSTMPTRCEFGVQFRLFARLRDSIADDYLDTLRLALSGYIPPVLQTHPNYHSQEPGFRHLRGELMGKGEGVWIFEEEYMLPLLWRRDVPVALPGRPGL